MADLLALVAVVGFALGIFAASLYALPWALVLFVGCLALTLSFAWFFGRRDAYLLPAVFLFLLACGSARTLVAPRTLPADFVPLLESPVTLEGTIVADPDRRATSQRITVQVEKGNTRTKILVVADPYLSFGLGDTVSVSGTLTRPQPFDTDGGRQFDYRSFLAKDGVFALVPRAHIERTGITRSIPLRAERSLLAGKHAFSHALEASLPEPSASLAEGLLTGGKQGLGTELLDAFTVAGLLPIVVLSGYNVMIVAESLLALLSFAPKRFALSLAALAVALFVLAAGAGTSAVRAGVMAGLALFARASGRTYDALRALIAVFALMLLWNPFSLAYDPGFQFSFAATLGLVLASAAFERRLLFIRLSSLREIAATTLAAQLFVLPLLLYETGNLSLVSILANMFVLPFVPLAMGLSAFAGATGLLIPALAPYAGLPAYTVLSGIMTLAVAAARIPFAHFVVPAFPALLLLPAYAAIAWLVLRIRKAAPSGAALLPVSVPLK